MLRKLFFILFSLFVTSLIQDAALCAPIWNFPISVVQPNGDSLHCYVSGDEFYNWVHDIEGYTIIQNQNNGYYVYADLIDGKLVPTNFIPGTDDPKDVGLKPGLNISPEEMKLLRDKFFEDSPEDMGDAPKTGLINNLVVFIRFSDQSEFTDETSVYNNMFNDSIAGANSMYNYFKEVSYNQLFISSTFYPTPPNSTVISFQDSYPRNYYMPYSALNPNGYSNSTERRIREHTLLVNAVNFISSQVSPSLNLDGDNDGRVDNVCFIISGAIAQGSMLMPHKWALYTYSVYINSKRVYDYNFQMQNHLLGSGRNNGVLSHEMFHTLGAPDLYHYSGGLNPVYKWDLMGLHGNPPQHMGAYMKYKYGAWISEIPEITSPGTYSLNPLTSSENNCYKILSPFSSSEYFVVEYRRKEGTFENTLLAGGLLVYRINTSVGGNGYGPPDEVYIYRPNGTLINDGSPDLAIYSVDVGRSSINDTTNPSSFLSDGSMGGLQIAYIGPRDTTIDFILGNGVVPLPLFTEITAANLTGVSHSSVAWGDYDNDRDLDILLTGYDGSNGVSKIYLNEGNDTFTEQTSIPLPGVYWSSVAWGDYDNDNYLDIILTGQNGSTYISKIYRNEGNNSFTEQTSITLAGVYRSSVDWGDYDNDGNLDILLTGNGVSKIYRNEGNNSFSEQTSISLFGVSSSSVDWGDYDNDGDLDIVLSGGNTQLYSYSKIYRNDGNNIFTEQSSISLFGLQNSTSKSVAWGDYDNDGDLDILLTGSSASNVRVSKIYRNNIITANTLPTSPTNLGSIVDETGVTLSWDKSTDSETPQNGLTYNLVLSTFPGGTDCMSPMSDRSTGVRNVVSIGNVNHNNSWTIKNLPEGIYYWSVQAIDNNFAGSAFATEQMIDNPFPVELTSFSAISTKDGIALKWRTETEVNNYGFEVERKTEGDEWLNIGFIEGHGNSNSPKEYSFIDKNLIGGSEFFYRLKQIDNDGKFTYSDEVEVVLIPTIFELAQNYPNPFNPSTTIKYQLPIGSKVTLKIYDVLGNEVITLLNEEKEAGVYEVIFNASNYSSGIYFYKLQAGSFVKTKKMVLLR